MTSRSPRAILSSIVFTGVDGPVPYYGALGAVCSEALFRLSHQSATGQEKLALVSGTGRLIPRTPTHVVIRETQVLRDYNDPGSMIDAFVPGVAVRVVERSGEWALIIVDGVLIGWTETVRLARLQ